MVRAQPVGERLQLIAAAGGEAKVAAFLGEGFGRGRANAFRGAGDKDALAAQMQIHGPYSLQEGRSEMSAGIVRRRAPWRSTLQCSVAPRRCLVHCNCIK